VATNRIGKVRIILGCLGKPGLCLDHILQAQLNEDPIIPDPEHERVVAALSQFANGDPLVSGEC
jgi:hypothetical protein